jgi:hypothetical protein
MLRRLFKATFLLLTFLFLACQDNNEADLLPTLDNKSDNELSVSEAKEWFQKEFSKARMNSSIIQSRALFRYATEYSFSKKDKQKYIILPIIYESSKFPSAVNSFKQLWIYKNIKKENTVRIMEFVRDQSLSKKEQEHNKLINFTGTMIIRTWDNEPLGGLIFKEGKITKAFRILKNKPNGRPSGLECGWVTTYKFFSVSSAFAPTYWYVEESTDYKCVVTLNLESDPPACQTEDCPVGGPQPEGGSSGGDEGGDPNEGGITADPSTFQYGNYTYKFGVQSSECSGRTELLRAQSFEGKEMTGLLTSTGKMIILSSHANTRHTAQITLGMQNDIFGRPSVWFNKTEDGSYEATLYYYNSPGRIPRSVQTHKITGTVHTHPQDSGYDWDNPSSEDKENIAAKLPTLDHYVVHNGTNGFFKYDQNGNRTTVNRCGITD